MKNTNLHPLFIQGFLDTVFEEVLDKEINQVTVGIITHIKIVFCNSYRIR